MPFNNRNTQGGVSISGGSLTPRTDRSGTGQINDRWAGGLPILATPTLSAYSYGADGSFTFTITNYDAAATYTLGTSAGSISRSTNTVTVSGLGNGGTATATVTASKSGFANSNAAQITGQSKPACSSCGSGSSSVQGCNGATCGIISCPSGYCPAYNIVSYPNPSPNPCVGCGASIGGWYCCGCGGVCG